MGQGVNYISDRLVLEDMHPANVFIDELTDKPICIDCIVKFKWFLCDVKKLAQRANFRPFRLFRVFSQSKNRFNCENNAKTAKHRENTTNL